MAERGVSFRLTALGDASEARGLLEESPIREFVETPGFVPQDELKGYEHRKPKGFPRVALEKKHAEFIALYERLLNGLGADKAVYFAAAVHPEHQTNPSYGWVKAGSNPAVTTTAGRGRVNVYGALNLETFNAPFVAQMRLRSATKQRQLAPNEPRKCRDNV